MKEPLYFQVTGEFVTDFARERYKETNDISIGVDFLKKSIIGLPLDIATDIILGKKKLVGCNHLLLDNDSTSVEPYGIIRPSDVKNVVCGWISPNGEVFGHRFHNQRNDHFILAERIVKRLHLNETYCESFLERRGYLKFDPYQVLAGNKKATTKQKDAVASICDAHHCKIQLGCHNTDLYSSSQINQMDLVTFNQHLDR